MLYEVITLRSMKAGLQKTIVIVAVVLLVLVTPQLANQVQNAILGAVMIFIVMGIGLNIVVGYAGLLDLGYVRITSYNVCYTKLLRVH